MLAPTLPDSSPPLERLPKRSALLIARTTKEQTNTNNSEWHILLFVANFYASEVTDTIDYLVQNNDLDSIYRMFVSIRQSLIKYAQNPIFQLDLYEHYQDKFLHRISDLVSHHSFEGLIGILSKDIQSILDNIQNGNSEKIETSKNSSEIHPTKPIQFVSSSVDLKYSKSRIQMMLLKAHTQNSILSDALYNHQEKLPILDSASGHEFCDHPQNLKFRSIASDAMVVTYRTDFSELPRFLATENNANCNITSYPDFVGDMEMKLRGSKTDLHRHLKIMHDAHLIQAIKKELGIYITQISLKFQIFFLEFLHQSTDTELENLKNVMISIEENEQPHFLEAFLVCSEKKELANSLLAITQNTQKKNLFLPAYSHFIKILEQTSKEVEALLKPLFLQFQRKFIILTGNHFLRAFSAAKSKTEQEILHDRFRSETNNISEIFTSLIQTIQPRCKAEMNICTTIFYRGANRQLTSMLERWKYPSLPEDFQDQITSPIEQIAIDEGDYFPVGISRNFDQFRSVFGGETQALKPASMLTYLFWMNIQRKELALVVCDKIQVNNGRLFETDSRTLENLIQKIGNHDANIYQQCLDYFGLDQIKIARYNHLTESDEFSQYKKLCDQLSVHPLFQKAFDRLTHEALSAMTENSKDIRAYATEEIAWILSHPHQKISHIREASFGYDPLSCVIKNVELLAQTKGVDDVWNSQNEDICRFLLCRVLLGLQHQLSHIIKNTKNEKKLYFENFRDFLFGNKKNKGVFDVQSIRPQTPRKIKITEVYIPFIVPEGISSQSFGNSARNFAGDISFIEPYSTIFIDPKNSAQNLQSLPLNNREGIESAILGKMDTKKQKIHMQKVLFPLVRMYRANLGSFSSAYFLQHGFTSVEEGQKVINQGIVNIKTYLDLLKFIRQFVLLPTAFP